MYPKILQFIIQIQFQNCLVLYLQIFPLPIIEFEVLGF